MLNMIPLHELSSGRITNPAEHFSELLQCDNIGIVFKQLLVVKPIVHSAASM